MKFKSGGIMHTKKEGNQLRAIKAKHNNIQDYLVEVLAWYMDLGIEIQLSEVPDNFQVDGRKGAGWYGTIRGEIINHIDDHRLSGGDVIWGSWCCSTGDPERMFVMNTAGGNGGPRFNYHSGSCLKVETLPKFKDEMFKEIEVAKFQIELDNKLATVLREQKSNINSEIYNQTYSNMARKALIKKEEEVEDILSAIKSKIIEVDDNIRHNAIRNNTFKLPEIKSGRLNLNEYNKARQFQTVQDCFKEPEVDFPGITARLKTFVGDNAEYFL